MELFYCVVSKKKKKNPSNVSIVQEGSNSALLEINGKLSSHLNFSGAGLTLHIVFTMQIHPQVMQIKR